MDNIIDHKIKIGISVCQFGGKVRYNGKGQDVTRLIGRERADFIWHPVCPEVMSGMGVPRKPVSLRSGNGDDFWAGRADIKSRDGVNMNDWMREGALASLAMLNRAGVRVYVFMEGSPSCGVYRTSIKNKRLGHPPGIFGSLLLREGFFLIPSTDLQSPIRWWDWRRRLFAFVWLDEKPFETPQEVVECWHILKFLCQELSRKEADALGRTIANMKSFTAEDFAALKRQILDLLRRPSEIRRIKQSLWKNYVFLKKHFGIESDLVGMPGDERGITRIAGELLALEILTAKEGLLFGPVPVHYRRADRVETAEDAVLEENVEE
jgi:uncharacterized protein YbbK (DUF523 family)